MSVAFRPIVQIDDQLFQTGKVLPSFLPPPHNAVNYKVAGFVVGAEKQERPAGNRLQDAARNQLHLGIQIMIQCLDSHGPTRTPTPGVFTDMDGRLGVYADSQGFRIRIGQRVYPLDIFKDGVGFGGFF